MKRIILTLLLVLGIGTSVAFAAVPSSTAQAAAKDEICNGVGAAAGQAGCAVGAGEPTVGGLVTTIVNILSWIVGVLAVIMLIWAGFQYVTSSGDSGKISTAKNTMIYAIIGIVVVAFAQTIVKFVLQKVG